MRKFIVNAAAGLLLLSSFLSAQTIPTSPAERKPTLRRDRTQRVLYPKIIQYEDERVVSNELTDMVTLSHGGVRRRAMLALGRIGYATGITHLIDALNDERNPAEFRALAAFALGEIESQYAVEKLVERLQAETSHVVRARIAEALGKIASNKFSADALGNYGVRAISSLLVRLLPATTEKPSEAASLVASMALKSLLRIKEPTSIEFIARQLGSPDAGLRWQAANALARIREGIGAAVPALLPLLADKEGIVRAHAARALGVAKDNRAVDPLVALLADKDEHVVINSVNALGTIADPRAVEPLVALGNNQLTGYRSFDRERDGVPTQQNVLLLVATALGNIKDQRSLAFLKSFRFADGKLGSSPEVEVAVAKLGEAAFFDIPESIKLPRDDWKAMAAYAQGLGELKTARARGVLLDLLAGSSYGKPDPRAVPDILNAAAAAKVEGLRDLLLDNLKAEDVIVRTTAATLLGGMNDSSEPVIKALQDAYKAARNDKMNDARIAILEAADKLKQPMNVQALAEATRDDDYVVRMKAAELLRQSETEGLTTRLQLGKVETGHNRDYWRRMAQLIASTKNPVAVLYTRKGNIRIELFAADAPMTVDNFIRLSRSGFYNGLTFMRVVPNFVIQGGDPRGDTNGGPGYQIRDEINLRTYQAGTVGMALSGKDTGGSQFFITHSPQPHLDGGYTVFGQVVEGMDVVNSIARGDRIERVEIIAGQ